MTTLISLRPAVKQNVKHVVELVGIPWSGSEYDWCFGKVEACVLFVWHKSLLESDGNIFFIDDSEETAADKHKAGATPEANRASAFHNLILTSYHRKLPIRVAIVDGKDKSRATKRVLDSDDWYPHHIDPETNRIVVIRGVPQPEDFDPQASYVATLKEMPIPASGGLLTSIDPNEPTDNTPNIQTSLTTTYTRDPEVARQAKQRALEGKCELCGERGFETAQGGFYLEAHHVIPRSCDGPDEIWNVAAICADHHKQAHFSVARQTIRDQLIQTLGGHYPACIDRLLELAKKMDLNAMSSIQLEENTET